MASSDPYDFRQLLTRALDRSGTTVYRLAKESGVPHQQIYRYLAGQSRIADDTAGQLLRVAGVKLTVELPRKLAKPEE